MPSLDSYYQPDFSHRNNKPRSKTSTAPQYEIGLDGVPVRTSGNPVSPTGGVMGGLPSDYKATESSAFASAARHRGQMADIRGGGGDTSSGRKPLPVTPHPADERTTTNSNGVVQTMKAMSSAYTPIDMKRSFNDLLATINTSGYQPFSSNQLPTTAGSPDSGITPKTQAILAGIQAGQQNDMSIDGYKGPGYITIQPDDPQFAEAFGQDLADKYKSAADSKVTGYTKGGRLDQALSDTAGINSYMSKFSSGDRERAANRAFLDTEGSMEGLRAKEAVNDVVYAGGQHYGRGALSDDAGIGDKYKIDRADARGIASGKNTAAGLLDTYKSRITEAQKSTPAEAQDPLSGAGSAVKSAFGAGARTDRKLQGKSTARDGVLGGIIAGAKTDFDLNNSN